VTTAFRSTESYEKLTVLILKIATGGNSYDHCMCSSFMHESFCRYPRVAKNRAIRSTDELALCYRRRARRRDRHVTFLFTSGMTNRLVRGEWFRPD
jgi:hypothetical protein